MSSSPSLSYHERPGGSDGKESACNAGDLGSVPGSGRSPGARRGNPPQYSCLENPTDRGTWWATVDGATVRHNWATNTLWATTLPGKHLLSPPPQIESACYLLPPHRTNAMAPCMSLTYPSSVCPVIVQETGISEIAGWPGCCMKSSGCGLVLQTHAK